MRAESALSRGIRDAKRLFRWYEKQVKTKSLGRCTASALIVRDGADDAGDAGAESLEF
jgi:hypothetical protein